MKKFFLFIILVQLSAFVAMSQENDYSRDVKKDKSEKENTNDEKPQHKLVWGGGLGLQFGNPTCIELSPKVGYKLTSRLMFGGGVSYIYYKENIPGFGEYKTSEYAGDVFGKFLIISGLFAHLEYEALNFKYYDYSNGTYERKWLSNVFVGGGYRQRIGANGFIEILLLYNLNYHTLSPYPSPWVPRINIFL